MMDAKRPARLHCGKPARTYGYSAPILGPVVRVCRGDEVEMVVENHLDAATTVHWHGLLVPGYDDGGPQQLIQAGERWRPLLKIDRPAATLWFHPHPHGDTARNWLTRATRTRPARPAFSKFESYQAALSSL
jgi:FtsP/CotA-like multicopper oxidase with cupredoxin domain